jgi:hypothetical protein
MPPDLEPSRPSRAVTPLLLAALLVGPAAASAGEDKSPFRPNARPLFEGCKPSAAAPAARSYECPGQTASLVYLGPQYGRMPDNELLEFARYTVGLTFQGDVRTQRDTLKFAAREQPAYHVTVKFEDGARLEGDITVDKSPGGRARLYSCYVEAGEQAALARCRRMLEYFSKHGAPEPIDLEQVSLARPSEGPTLLSRKLAVPKGCGASVVVEGSGKIDCPTSTLTWQLVDSGPEPSQWVRELAALTAKNWKGELSESPVKCTIEQQPGVCVRLRATGLHGTRRDFYVGAIRSGTNTLGVLCSSNDQDGPLPPVCKETLALEPPAAPGKTRP